MATFLRAKEAHDVVEVGSDVQLRLALRLAPHCRTFYSVNFPEDHERMRGWYELHRDMGGVENLVLLSGNAVRLPDLIGHADVILVKNVLIAGSETELELLANYRMGVLRFSEEELAELRARFLQAKEDAYRGFLRVAKPGHVVWFGRPEEGEGLRDMLVEKLGVPPDKIQTRGLFYDETRDMGEAYFIDNP